MHNSFFDDVVYCAYLKSVLWPMTDEHSQNHYILQWHVHYLKSVLWPVTYEHSQNHDVLWRPVHYLKSVLWPMTDEHGTILEAVLVSHYSHESNPSYLDLVQRVCHDLTDSCHGVMHDSHDHNPLVGAVSWFIHWHTSHYTLENLHESNLLLLFLNQEEMFTKELY